ncbi:DUF4288 domain-containing protein [Leptolyngbya sp. NIES-2104]|uniref:DUF4288 domain-containing protein n=1 Tax=Leptolyngbya sp. NIES-2104 TaxID=1552121 RepID=UPI0006ECCCB0|nr:DUF4288 domain-containing protein [Leptolyngbya sp. NIES-2104]GAQ00132.1 hypothetical protein NIES2104_66970 [Leptolyngbya sp. NIES-2104]
MSSTRHYMAIVLYESSCSASDYKPLYEECWTIIEADSEEHARQKAHTHAQQAQHSYENQFAEMITVTFKQIVDVAPLLNDVVEDGAELYARFFRNYQAYCQFEPLLGGEPL